jgi:hypothetical protein
MYASMYYDITYISTSYMFIWRRAFDGGDVSHALGVVPPEAAEHGGVAQLHLAEIADHWQIQHLIPCTGRRLMYA